MDLGSTIILAGLVVQVLIFGFSLAIGIVFHVKMRNGPRTNGSWDWERYFVLLYAVSLNITFRNLFRVIRYTLGGKILSLLLKRRTLVSGDEYADWLYLEDSFRCHIDGGCVGGM